MLHGSPDPVYRRKVGKTVLAVYAVNAGSSLAGGRTTASHDGTGYRVVACANTARPMGTALGTFRSLSQARDYADAYSPAFGLLGKPRPLVNILDPNIA